MNDYINIQQPQLNPWMLLSKTTEQVDAPITPAQGAIMLSLLALQTERIIFIEETAGVCPAAFSSKCHALHHSL